MGHLGGGSCAKKKRQGDDVSRDTVKKKLEEERKRCRWRRVPLAIRNSTVSNRNT